jgi:hypothetical protein
VRLELRKTDRNGLLMVSLLALIVFSPYIEKGSLAGTLFNVLQTFVMITGSVAAARTHGRTKLVGIAIALALLAGVLVLRQADPDSIPILYLIEILFFIVIGASVLGKVFAPGQVSLDRIFGAIAVYLMMGLVLGSACRALELYQPGSFSGAVGDEGVTSSDMYYFGYVTLTTLGYGDIAPVTAKARSLALLGAITGPLYIAVLVARLVGDFGTDQGGAARSSEQV